MQPSTDPYLIQKTLEGDTKAFGQLVDKYQTFVFTIVIRMLKVREEAEEVAQDTFIKAYQSLDKFRGDSKFSSWLYSIAYRKALDALRKSKKNSNLELIEDITEGDCSVIENALSFLETEERKEAIQNCIMKLPEQEAAIITLFYFEEQSIKEIAVITDLSEENIKIKLYRSRKKMFTLLKQNILPKYTETNGKAI
ncbi:MAG: sigma-70 family RNA polymerase sigma factor [Flavobacteriaceae bacterium]|nr:sigma-70 family RNA polymerase sigma factor [Flavobacteriaceae bacterium]